MINIQGEVAAAPLAQPSYGVSEPASYDYFPLRNPCMLMFTWPSGPGGIPPLLRAGGVGSIDIILPSETDRQLALLTTQ